MKKIILLLIFVSPAVFASQEVPKEMGSKLLLLAELRGRCNIFLRQSNLENFMINLNS